MRVTPSISYLLLLPLFCALSDFVHLLELLSCMYVCIVVCAYVLWCVRCNA